MRPKKNDPSKPARRNFLSHGFTVGAASLALPAFARAMWAQSSPPGVKPFV